MSEVPTCPMELDVHESGGLRVVVPPQPTVFQVQEPVRETVPETEHILPFPEPETYQTSHYFRRRMWFDRLVAGAMLLVALPVIGILVLLVRLTSKGPGIYRQRRVGCNNEVFTIYKIRTMVNDAEKKTGAVWAKRNDCRVTWVGKVLRTLHLDELPQLFNVVRGDMALVGPRPERPEIVSKLAEEIEDYPLRHQVPPGITGLAQLNLPADTDLESVRRKLYLDLQYIREANFWLDFRIVCSTIPKMLAMPVETSLRWFCLRREVPRRVVSFRTTRASYFVKHAA